MTPLPSPWRHRAPGRSCGTQILDLNRGRGAQILRLDLRVSSGAEPEPPPALAASRRALVKVRMEESSSSEFQRLRLRGLRRTRMSSIQNWVLKEMENMKALRQIHCFETLLKKQ
nr:hypothetical protein CFP56_14746 [Quercus suber]